MANRIIKDAKDAKSNELIYFRGHAKATYMSDGRTVEDAINNINLNGDVYDHFVSSYTANKPKNSYTKTTITESLTISGTTITNVTF